MMMMMMMMMTMLMMMMIIIMNFVRGQNKLNSNLRTRDWGPSRLHEKELSWTPKANVESARERRGETAFTGQELILLQLKLTKYNWNHVHA